jgi:hypothetical protein
VNAVTRLDKGVVAKGVVTMVREVGGKFLKQDKKSGIWVDIGDKKAHDKVCHAFRDVNRSIATGKRSHHSESSKSSSKKARGEPETPVLLGDHFPPQVSHKSVFTASKDGSCKRPPFPGQDIFLRSLLNNIPEDITPFPDSNDSNDAASNCSADFFEYHDDFCSNTEQSSEGKAYKPSVENPVFRCDEGMD